MSYLAGFLGVLLVAFTLIDAFEVVLLPRPVRRRIRLHRYFFKITWGVWRRVAQRWPRGPAREDFIGVYGPLSMVMIFALWAVCLIAGFGLLQWAVQSPSTGDQWQSLASEMIVSGDAFFTLGYGDIVPRNAMARLLVILEAGTGFGFIALTVGYLPVLYQHFVRRDLQLIEFTARAGARPTAAALLAWHAQGTPEQLDRWLRDWEVWACDIVESHSVYPMLAFYRSQHEGQSWLAALAVVLDTCALLITGREESTELQSAATFSAARRVLDEISQSLRVGIEPHRPDRRLPVGKLERLSPIIARVVPGWQDDAATLQALGKLTRSYEPQLESLAAYLLLDLPDWITDDAPLPAVHFGRDQLIAQLTHGRADSRDV